MASATVGRGYHVNRLAAYQAAIVQEPDTRTSEKIKNVVGEE